jgi:hypothetical protein
MRVSIPAGRGHHDKKQHPDLQDGAKMSRLCPKRRFAGQAPPTKQNMLIAQKRDILPTTRPAHCRTAMRCLKPRPRSGSKPDRAGIAEGDSRPQPGGPRFAGANRASATTIKTNTQTCRIGQNVAPLPQKTLCRPSASYKTEHAYTPKTRHFACNKVPGNRFAISRRTIRRRTKRLKTRKSGNRRRRFPPPTRRPRFAGPGQRGQRFSPSYSFSKLSITP